MEQHNVKVWLVNTGWIKGSYGKNKGARCPLKYTRALINKIHDGTLSNEESSSLPLLDLKYYSKVDGIPEEVTNPLAGWEDKESYLSTLKKLANKFISNFGKYKLPELEKSGPNV